MAPHTRRMLLPRSRGCLGPGAPLGFVVAMVLLALLTLPRTAFAWVEMHVAKDDVRLEIDPGGTARVEHRIVLLVSGGPLKSFVVRGVDPDATEPAGVYALEKTSEDHQPLTVAIAPTAETDDGARARTDLHVRLGEGISRGRWLVVLRYRTDLKANGSLSSDGASTSIRWVGPTWDDGLDTTRATFVVPPAPTAPRAIEPDDDQEARGEAPATFLEKLERLPSSDSLEVIRPYASKGERVVWTLRVDRRALPFGPGPGVTTAPAVVVPAPTESVAFVDPRGGAAMAAALLAFLALAAAITAHGVAARRRAEEQRQLARPVLPLPLALRAILGAAAFVAGVALEITLDSSLPGAMLVASFALFVWHAPARTLPAPRAPGAWLAVTAHEAFGSGSPRVSPSFFDVRTWAGRIALASWFAAVALSGAALAKHSSYAAVLALLDGIPLLALFLTGGARFTAPDPAVDAAPFLRDVVQRLTHLTRATRVVPRIRIPKGAVDPDEMRVVLLPERPLRGLRSVEVATAWITGPGGRLLLPEILVRADDTSPCGDVLRSLHAYGKAQRGRRPNELVLSVSPKLPTARLTAQLAAALLDKLRSPPDDGLAARKKPAPSSPGARPDLSPIAARVAAPS